MHFYSKDNKPVYEVATGPKAKNPTRPTAVKDAIALDLVPSVTEIDKAICKNEGLDLWIKGQIAKWCYDNPSSMFSHTEEDYIELALKGGSEKGRLAMDKGTLIHDALEHYLLHGSWGDAPIHIHPWFPYAEKFVNENIKAVYQAEKAVASTELGVGGKMDLVCEFNHGIGSLKTVLDWKTQDVKIKKLKRGDEKDPKFYDSWIRQLALYSLMEFLEGLPDWAKAYFISTIKSDSSSLIESTVRGLPRIVSVVIDSNEPCDFFVKVWSNDEILTGLNQALANLHAWHMLYFKPKGCII